MSSAHWIDRAWVGVLPDFSRFAQEANRGIVGALRVVETQTGQIAGNIEDNFDRAIVAIGHRFRSLHTDTAAAGDQIQRDLHASTQAAGSQMERDLKASAQASGRALQGIGTDARQGFQGLHADARQAGDQVQREMQQTAQGSARALEGISRDARSGFAALRGEATSAGNAIERSFEETGRDSQHALQRIGVGAGTAWRALRIQADTTASSIQRSFTTASLRVGGILGAFRARAFGVGAVVAGIAATMGGAFVKMGIDAVGSMEQAQISFEQLLGSGDKARRFLADLNTFAAKTPFELPGLIATSRQLLGAGQAAKSIIPTLTAVGNATGALGLQQEQFERIMLAVTQSMNKGRIQGEELMQMQEAGLPVTGLLSKALGVTSGELLKMAEKGKLASDEVFPKLFEQMQKDYAGSMVRQSTTLNGLMSTFMDTVRNGLREALTPLLPMLREALPVAGERIKATIQTLGRVLSAMLGWWVENKAAITGFAQSLGDVLAPGERAKALAGGLADGLQTLFRWWHENEVAISLLVDSFTTSYVPATDQAAAATASLSQTSLSLKDVLDATLQVVAWVSIAYNGLAVAAAEVAAVFGDLVIGLGYTLNAVDRLSGGTGHAAQAIVDYGRELKANAIDLQEQAIVRIDQASSAMRLLGQETQTGTTVSQDYTAAVRDQRAAVEELTGALAAERGAQLNLEQAQLGVERSQQRLTELRRQGKTGTLEYRQAQLDLERAKLALTQAEQDYAGKVAASTDKERTAAHQSDVTRGAYDRLKGSLIGAGKQATQFALEHNKAIDALKSKALKVTANYNIGAPRGVEVLIEKGLVRATGGEIRGWGTTTSDSVPVLASDQEHMVAAREVLGLGGGSYAAGHQALKDLRASWRTMAAGGPVLRYEQPGREQFLAAPARFNRIVDASMDASARGFRKWINDAVKRLVFPAPGGVPVSAQANRAIVLDVWKNLYGWVSAALIAATDKLLMGESGYSNTAQNRTSTAYGIFQFLNGTWGSVGGFKTSDPRLQAVFGGRYIQGSYGSPVGAYAAWASRSPHWYDAGGLWPPGTVGLNQSGRTERVLDPEQSAAWAAIERATTGRATPPAAAGPTTVAAVGAGGMHVENLNVAPVSGRFSLREVYEELVFAQRQLFFGTVH